MVFILGVPEVEQVLKHTNFKTPCSQKRWKNLNTLSNLWNTKLYIWYHFLSTAICHNNKSAMLYQFSRGKPLVVTDPNMRGQCPQFATQCMTCQSEVLHSNQSPSCSIEHLYISHPAECSPLIMSHFFLPFFSNCRDEAIHTNSQIACMSDFTEVRVQKMAYTSAL